MSPEITIVKRRAFGSDATVNRFGVRMGTSEIHSAVGVVDSAGNNAWAPHTTVGPFVATRCVPSFDLSN
jgi:hypothetical protein